jgi:hypothetical protein
MHRKASVVFTPRRRLARAFSIPRVRQRPSDIPLEPTPPIERRSQRQLVVEEGDEGRTAAELSYSMAA